MAEDAIYAILMEIKDKINDNHLEVLQKLDGHVEAYHKRHPWINSAGTWQIVSIGFALSLMMSASILAFRASDPASVLTHTSLLTKGATNATTITK